AELRALLPGPAARPSTMAVELLPDEAAPSGASVAASDLARWQISLRFGADALRNGLDPLAFLRYLATLGTVRTIETLVDAVPPLAALDAEGCCLGFELAFDSAASHAQIADVFDFCASDCDIAIHGPEPLQAATPTPTSIPTPTQTQTTPSALAIATPSPTLAAADDPAAHLTERRDGPRERRGGEEVRFIRVRADKLDRLIDQIGELVIASSGAQLVAQTERSPAFAEAALRIHDLVQDARDGALSLRMVPIGETFSRFNRVVRDVSKQLGKDVELHISGGDTELDKSMVETLADPLMHLVRNSLDHGIEPGDERLASGKPVQGRLALHAYHESGSILIEVSDDGRGLNRERILARAVERGLVAPEAQLSTDEIHHLIFAPGFSTAEVVTNLSGRGVGMDVVKRNIEQLRGQIRIASQPGLGSTMQIRLPLTLAIIDGFLTSVGGVSYVLPLERVAECLEVPPACAAAIAADPQRITGHFDLRGEVLPYLDLGRFYGHAAPRAGTRRSLVLVRDGASRVGLIVDRLHGEHQTVIKPLGEVFQSIRGLAGSTILGSGDVALILDVPALLDLASSQALLRHALIQPSLPPLSPLQSHGRTPPSASAPGASHPPFTPPSERRLSAC
ncbi:MAG: chemotaxis protein CheA, partial [Leptothrix sp. (in: b-proteobacteria)]